MVGGGIIVEKGDAGSQRTLSLSWVIVEHTTFGNGIVEESRAATRNWKGTRVSGHRGAEVIKDRITGIGVVAEVCRATATVGTMVVDPIVAKVGRVRIGIVFKNERVRRFRRSQLDSRFAN